MEFVIVTGISGSGKSTAINVLEDIGYYCIDNMPPELMSKFAEICAQSDGKMDKVAFVADVRGGDLFLKLKDAIQDMRGMGIKVKVMFLDCSDDTIIRRYKETRRKHPLSDKFNGSIHEAINFEWTQLSQLREIADYYIETSNFTTSQLKEQVKSIFLEKSSDSLIIKVMSFGFKYGVSTEADLVFDVRCLPNPFYIEELRNHTGCDSCVRDYVMSFEQSKTLFDKLKDLIDYLIPLYVQEGKSQLVIAFGCTGGKHRSITFAELMADHLIDKDYKVQKYHRDITKDKKF